MVAFFGFIIGAFLGFVNGVLIIYVLKGEDNDEN